MDTAALAKSAVDVLAPCLPSLLSLGGVAASEAAKKVGADTWERAKSLWAKLWPKAQATPEVKSAAEDAAKNPNDADALAALRHQLKKLLAEDQVLAAEVAAWNAAEQGAGASSSATAIGERSVAVGRDVTGGNISTGDQSGSRRSPGK